MRQTEEDSTLHEELQEELCYHMVLAALVPPKLLSYQFFKLVPVLLNDRPVLRIYSDASF